MCWAGVDLEDVRLLHDPAGVHDCDPVGHVGDDAEVMSDEDQAHMPFLLQISEESHDLRLHRDVQCSRRLVGDQDGRVQRDRHSDHDALPHTSGELMREGLDALPGSGDLDPLHQADRLFEGVALVHAPVLAEHLRDLPADREDGVQ
jgi:hypothetical protein